MRGNHADPHGQSRFPSGKLLGARERVRRSSRPEWGPHGRSLPGPAPGSHVHHPSLGTCRLVNSGGQSGPGQITLPVWASPEGQSGPHRSPTSGRCTEGPAASASPAPWLRASTEPGTFPQASPCADGASRNDGGQVSTGTGYGLAPSQEMTVLSHRGWAIPRTMTPGLRSSPRGPRRFW